MNHKTYNLGGPRIAGSNVSEPHPVIFLDIDGVLTTSETVFIYGNNRIMSPLALKFLERLCLRTGARVVISSTWRVGRAVDELQELFRRAGSKIIAERIIDKTPKLTTDHRGEEISKWLLDYSQLKTPCRYAIIDDDADLSTKTQMQHLVQTNPLRGFGLVEYHRALRLLNPDDFEELRTVSGLLGVRT